MKLYTFDFKNGTVEVVWEEDIPTPIASDSLLSCEQFAAMMECTVDELWAM